MNVDAKSNLFVALRKLYSHLSLRRKRQLVWVMILLLFGALAELLTLGAIMPFLALMADPERAASNTYLQAIIYSLGWDNPNQLLLPSALLFVVAALFAGFIRIVIVWVSQKYIFRVGYDLSVDVYNRTLYQPYIYHASKNSGELIAGVGKVQNIVGSVIHPLMQIAMSVVMTVFILGALIYIHPMVALTAASGFGLIYLVITYATRKQLKLNSSSISNAQNERIKALQEGYGGIRDITIDQVQPVYAENYGRVDLALRNAQMVNAFIGQAPYYAIQALAMVLIAALAYALSISFGGLAPALPLLGALALGAQRLMPMLQLMYKSISQIIGHQQVLLDVLDLLALPLPASAVHGNTDTPLEFKEDIRLEAVGFHYSPHDTRVLEDINLVIKKGSRVGFIGKTGSGKSTLLDLIMGLLNPSSGTIYVDRIPLAEGEIKSWQKRIAHVPQSIYLSDTTIAENIAFGVMQEDIDFERVRDAAQRAQIADYIETLRDGYNTVIGERGIRLSGGQRQRIGIARALYKKADLLIFDEATSALDCETETEVMNAIHLLDANLTVLIIAHRLTTIEHCDKIVKIENGRIIAEGPFKDINISIKKNIEAITEETGMHAH